MFRVQDRQTHQCQDGVRREVGKGAGDGPSNPTVPTSPACKAGRRALRRPPPEAKRGDK